MTYPFPIQVEIMLMADHCRHSSANGRPQRLQNHVGFQALHSFGLWTYVNNYMGKTNLLTCYMRWFHMSNTTSMYFILHVLYRSEMNFIEFEMSRNKEWWLTSSTWLMPQRNFLSKLFGKYGQKISKIGAISLPSTSLPFCPPVTHDMHI